MKKLSIAIFAALGISGISGCPGQSEKQLLSSEHDFPKSEPLYKRSLAIREKPLDPDHLDLAASLKNLAVLYRATRRNAEAEALERRAARIRANKR